jgi:hypothetical protein
MLILSNRDDVHARAVAWALERNGYVVELFDLDGVPATLRLTQHIDGAAAADGFRLRCGSEQVRLGGPVWLRRSGRIAVPDHVRGEEAMFVRREAEHHVFSALLLLERSTRMTNPFSASRTCAHKPFQLGVARSLGIPIPETLVSNDPEEIRSFCRSGARKVIYKPMSVPFFSNESGPLLLETRRIRAEHLEEDDVLAAAPGLFQQEIDKAWEVRVLMLAGRTIALRFRPEERDAVDWRAGHRSGFCEPIALPPKVEASCRLLLSQLGLDYGCIDLAIDGKGDFIFLEVNSEGQFLFMEQRVPECRVLEHFTTFLMGMAGAARPSVALAFADAAL